MVLEFLTREDTCCAAAALFFLSSSLSVFFTFPAFMNPLLDPVSAPSVSLPTLLWALELISKTF